MGGVYASARDISAMFYCLRAPKHPFGSRKGNAIEIELTKGGRKKYVAGMERKADGKGQRVVLFAAVGKG